MSWFVVDDDAHDHPKMVAAGNAALGLWMRCGAYSAKYGLGGFVPTEIARSKGRPGEIGSLVRVGLWLEVDGGYRFHDWDDRNDSTEQAKAKRAQAAARQRRWRDRQAGITRNETRDETRESRCSDPTRPDPTQLLQVTTTTTSESYGADGGGGGSFDDRYAEALDLAVDAALTREPRPPAHPERWKAAVRSRIDREHGPTISQAIHAGSTPADALPAELKPARNLLKGAWNR